MDIKETATQIAKDAGRFLRENFGKQLHLEFKGAVDLVTEMDKRCEDLIISSILQNFPDHGILTEESEEVASDSGYRWIIDPIDGTTNYAHGYPVYSVSIAFEADGVVEFGCVYDPMLDELFTAERGNGARLNGEAIRVSTIDTVDKGLLATGFPYDIRTSELNNIENFANFARRAQAIRRAGSAALDLCNVGCGRFDGFWELKLRAWDVAAASLVVREAGGRVTDFKGDEVSIFAKETLATNGLIHDEMVSVLAMNKVGI